MIIDPPQRFIRVREDLSRGTYPSLSAMTWLKEQGHRHLVYVGTGMPGRSEVSKIKELSFTFTHVPLAQVNIPGEEVFDNEDVQRVIKVLNNIGSGRSIYLFDDDGISAVGFVTALLRIDQGWSTYAALEELTWLAGTDIDNLTLASIRHQLISTTNN